MKKASLFLLALCAFALSNAQVEQDKDYSYYQNLYTKLYKAYVKQPENVANNYALAEYYSDTLNPMHNCATAMKFITAAEKRYIAIVEDRDSYKEVSKLIKKKITVVLVRQKKQEIMKQAYYLLDSDTILDEGTLNSYAESFRDVNSIMRIIEERRINLKFQQTREKNTLEAYKAFYDSYPSTIDGETAATEMGRLAFAAVAKADNEKQVDSILAPYLYVPSVARAATKRKSAIAYARLEKSPSPNAYKEFLSQYPGSDEYSLVLEKMDRLLDDEFNKLSTPQQYADFALQNEDNPLAEEALEKLKKMILEERNPSAAKIYLENFPLDVSYNEIYLEFYRWHTEEGNRSPIETFYGQYPDFPYQTAIEEALFKAEKVDSIDINMPFHEADFKSWASKIYHLTGRKVSFVALQRTMQQFIATKRWNKIPERIDFFTLSFEDDCVDEVAEFRSITSAPDNTSISFSPTVRPAYDMMHPVFHPDGNQLFYNRVEQGVTTIQSAQLTTGRKGRIWRSNGPLTFTNINNVNLNIYSLFNNGNSMLLGYGGDIMCATLGDNGWTVVETLPEPVNSPYYDYDASMLPDGSGILFASDRPNGYNLQPSRSYFHGDTALASDIYFVPRHKDGSWGEAINLGSAVNSPYMECSPLISDDLKTLYFITDGRGGLGYGDLYYTTRDNIRDWQHWTKPVNYGKETNSGFNELSVTAGNTPRTLTVCSNQSGRYGCYSVTAMHAINNKFKTVSVKTDNVGMSVSVVDLESKKFITENQPVPRDSVWQSSFYTDKHYLLLSSVPGLFVPGVEFSPSDKQLITPNPYSEFDLLDLSMSGQDGIPLPAIDFESERSTVYSFSLVELQHLADFLKRHSDISVEFSVNVDGFDDTFCFNLSQARGQEIKKILVTNGIDPDRIAVAGYGNSRTKRNNSTPSVSALFHSDVYQGY